MAVEIKRVYEKPAPADGTRVLVDRLWPRGVKKEAARIDEWIKDVAPSNPLRRWYHARPTQWLQFRKRYLEELEAPAASAALERLHRLATRKKKLTLVYASRREENNNATVLRDLLNGMKKPPTGTGPAAAAAGARRARAKRP